MKKVFTILLTILIMGSIFAGIATAQPEYVWKLSHNGVADPWENPLNYHVFQSELARLSSGKVRVDIYPNAQLGDNASSLEQCAQGSIEIVCAPIGVLASMYFDKIGILEGIPFIFNSRELARRALDVNNPFIRDLIEECAEKTGIRILSFFPFGARHLTNSVRPVHTPDDMKGLKIRVQEIVPHMELIKSLGATPTPIPFSELYTSLQSKVVDGQENPIANIEVQKFYQVQKYCTLTGHIMGIVANFFNEELYQSLPDDIKLSLIEATRSSDVAHDGLGSLFDSMGIETLKSHGMEIYSPSPEELAMFRDMALPTLQKWAEERFGKEFVAEFLEEVQKARDEIKEEALIK